MTPEEKQSLLGLMESGAQVFQDAVKSVPEQLARKRPAPDRWSALECAEHVAVAEESLFSRVAAAKHSDVPAIDELRESDIIKNYPERSERFEAPEPVRPTGRFSSLDQALAQFLASRARTIRFVEQCDFDLHSQLTTHSRLGRVNCYEVLLLIAMHPRRHAAQIQEIRAAVASTPTHEMGGAHGGVENN